MDPELREALHGIETRLREEIRAGDAETRRFAGVQIEALRGDVQTVAEGVAVLNDKFDRLDTDHARTAQRVDGLEIRVSVLEQAERTRRRRRRR